MHAPDGFLTAGTAVATGALSVAGIGVSLRRARDELSDRMVPLAGLTAAFVFAAQMVNFPIGGGVSGHLIGAALAAVLLGPWVGTLVVAVVVMVQALLFADGGITALGYNVLNMAIVPAMGGWAVFRAGRRVLPERMTSVPIAAGFAGFVSIVEMVRAGVVKIDGLLHEPEPEKVSVEVVVDLGWPTDAGDVVYAGYVHGVAFALVDVGLWVTPPRPPVIL